MLFRSISLLLLLTVFLKAASLAHTTRWLGQTNPLLPLSERGVLFLVVGAELFVAAFLFHPRFGTAEKLTASGWLLASFGLYRAGIWFFDIPRACGCLGDPAAWWPWLAQHSEQVSALILIALTALWLAAVGIAVRETRQTAK